MAVKNEGSQLLGSQQFSNNESPASPASQKQKAVIIDTWLSQFEQRIAQDFQRRTGLDYQTTIAQIIEAAEPFPGMRVLDAAARKFGIDLAFDHFDWSCDYYDKIGTCRIPS